MGDECRDGRPSPRAQGMKNSTRVRVAQGDVCGLAKSLGRCNGKGG